MNYYNPPQSFALMKKNNEIEILKNVLFFTDRLPGVPQEVCLYQVLNSKEIKAVYINHISKVEENLNIHSLSFYLKECSKMKVNHESGGLYNFNQMQELFVSFHEKKQLEKTISLKPIKNRNKI